MLRLIVVLLFCFSQAFANVPSAYFQMNDGFGEERKVLVDGKVYEMDFFGSYDLQNAFASNSTAIKLNQKHKQYARVGFWVSLSSLAVGLGLMIDAAYDYSKKSTQYWGGLGVMVVGSVVGMHYHQKSEAHLYESLNIYNGIPTQFRVSFVNKLQWQIDPIKEGAVAKVTYIY